MRWFSSHCEAGKWHSAPKAYSLVYRIIELLSNSVVLNGVALPRCLCKGCWK